MKLSPILSSPERDRLFPVVREGIFLAHAAVAPVTGPAREAMDAWSAEAAAGRQEGEAVWKRVTQTRRVAARFLGCEAEEISLLGPTALGLGLVALGLDWKAGDEVIFDPLDYPANVYPWKELQRKGVRAVPIQRNPGEPIRWETLRSLAGPKTRLVSLATAHYLSGHLPELSVIGPELKKRNILLCLDGIQTLGVLPPLLGSWNVVSPDFLAQPEIRFEAGGRRYEPGSLNLPGIEGMRASLELLDSIGLAEVSAHALALARQVREGAVRVGFSIYGGSGEGRVITSLLEPVGGWEKIKTKMEAAKVRVSWRKEHGGKTLLRVAPHVSNTAEEIGEFLSLLKG
ncbi:MAG: aminotransferase class V-fold PLP-dependent enzyme [Verrucomicrobia bacterium]|nr:aminotransferase class V-fold PLP-dependent enzyme [Verrucomicrobiota bacterium]